jgi:hypothetical protein
MTIYGNDNPEFIAEAIKTDESLEGDDSVKMVLSIMEKGETRNITLSKTTVDEKFFELMIEFLYGRSKMNLMQQPQQVEDMHSETVEQVKQVVQEMPIEQFTAQEAEEMLNESRGRTQQSTGGKTGDV